MMWIKSNVLLAFIFASVAAHAGEIYKWVDNDGQVHYGDAPPQAQESAAQKLTLKDSSVSDDARKKAEQQFSRDKAYLSSRPRQAELSGSRGYSGSTSNAQPSSQSGWVIRRVYCRTCRDDDRDDRRERSEQQQSRPPQQQFRTQQSRPQQSHPATHH
jgi:hypothetical protein